MPFYRAELHCHCQGDPCDTYLQHTVFETIDQARAVGLDILAITWHRKIFNDPAATAYARERGLLLVNGIEAEVDQRHLVVLNVEEGDLSGHPSWEEIRALRRRKPGVVTMAPHPFYPDVSCLGAAMHTNLDCFDAIEWCRLHINWLPNLVSPNERAARWARRHGKTLIACSDAHSLAVIGCNASTVEADELSVEALVAAIRANRVTFDPRSMELKELAVATGKALGAQPRHIGAWLKFQLRKRRAAAVENS